MSTAPRVLLLGIDHLDWDVLQMLVDKHYLPAFQQLLNVGVASPFVSSHEETASSFWTTLLTGVEPVTHGVLHDLEAGFGGVGATPIRAARVRVPRIWDYLTQAGFSSHVIGWPAMSANTPHQGISVANGIQRLEAGIVDVWPLAPDAVFPTTWREQVLDHRVFAADLPERYVHTLLDRLPFNDQSQVAIPCRLLFAQLLSLHSIALQMAQDTAQPWDLLALRFDTFKEISQLPLHIQLAVHPVEYLLGWYQFLDGMLATYMAMLRETDYLILVSDRGVDADLMGQYARAHRSIGDGVLMMAGPNIAKGELIESVSTYDFAPTILAMLGLSAHEKMPGKCMIGDHAPCSPVSLPVDWPSEQVGVKTLLQYQHCLYPPTSLHQNLPEHDGLLLAQLRVARQIYEHELYCLARTYHQQGNLQQAAELFNVLFSQPFIDANPLTRLQRCARYCQCLLALGDTAKVESIVEQHRLKAVGPAWNLAIDGMLHFALARYEQAIVHFNQLKTNEESPINAALWLAQTWLKLDHIEAAEQALQLAIQHAVGADQAWWLLASLLKQQQRWQEALVAIHKAIAFQPAHPQFLLARFEIYTALGMLNAARFDALRVLKLAPDTVNQKAMHALLLQHHQPQGSH